MKPILFNTEMVQAILEGKKTCTRRIVKPQPVLCNHGIYKDEKRKNEPSKWIIADEGYAYCGLCGNGINFNGKGYLKTPYKIGDILYARETFRYVTIGEVDYMGECEWDEEVVEYKASQEEFEETYGEFVGEYYEWKPSIHMPKKLARIFLKVTDVRIERLQDITEEGVIQEGLHPYIHVDGSLNAAATKTSFMGLWNSTISKKNINQYGWKINPWVWVIQFERVSKEEAWGDE